MFCDGFFNPAQTIDSWFFTTLWRFRDLVKYDHFHIYWQPKNKAKLAAKLKETWAKLKKFFLFRNEIKNVSQAAQIISSCFFNKEKIFRWKAGKIFYESGASKLPAAYLSVQSQGTVFVLGSILRIVLKSSPSVSFVSQKW